MIVAPSLARNVVSCCCAATAGFGPTANVRNACGFKPLADGGFAATARSWR